MLLLFQIEKLFEYLGLISAATLLAFGLIKYLSQQIFETYLQRGIETHKSDLDRITKKNLFIHRLQFEAEFNIYKNLWHELIDLRRKTEKLSPEIDISEVGKTHKETVSDRLKEVVKSGNIVIEEVQNNKPFYAESVYIKIDEMVKIVKREFSEIRLYTIRDDDTNFWENRDKNIIALKEATENVCAAIRVRIGIISKI